MAASMKQLQTKQDLAIYGAAPAFAEPLHVGRPNIGDREHFLQFANAMFDRRWLTNNGPIVLEFEAEVAKRLSVKHCVAMCNGTIALEIAIRALGLTGEVIVPAYTFVATAHSLHWQGIKPIFADIDPKTHNLDPASVRRQITPNTTGIMGVHLWGRPCDVQSLQDIADDHGLPLLFDAAHAFGCSYQGVPVGNFGRCEVLSFHATKFFNTFEGGAVVTNDDELAQKIRLIRNFGFQGYDNVIHPGTNGKMVEICAAMGLTNLMNVDSVIEGNRRTHQKYTEEVGSIAGIKILSFDNVEQSNFQYIVAELSDELETFRDRIVETLQAENILARKYFWPGVHKMSPYHEIQPDAGECLPVTESIANRVIVFPAGPSIDILAIKTIRRIIELTVEIKT